MWLVGYFYFSFITVLINGYFAEEPQYIHSYTFCKRWAGHVARMREKRYVYSLMVGKPEGTRPLKDQDVGG
jgi:hypothetical protein